MNRSTILVVAVLLHTAFPSVNAQGRAGARAAIRAERRAEQQQQKQEVQPGSPQLARRQQLQQQVRRSLWKVAKQRIGFSDQQMSQLEQTSQRYDRQRRQLAADEKAQRVTLRREILADSAASQAEIAAALDRLHAVQQRRLDLQAEEQKEFAGFMTPLQRARFAALQEQVRKRLLEFERTRSQGVQETLPDAP